MKELTKAEERVMQILWKLDNAFTRDVVNAFEDNKPSYTTVATVLGVLEQKGFVSHKMLGNSKFYTPSISKAKYSEFSMNNVLGKYFEGSLSQLVSFFAEKKKLDIEELNEIIEILESKK